MSKLRLHLLTCLSILLSIPVFSQFKSKSVLSEGNVYKFKLETTGVYKVSFSDLQDNTDLNLTQLSSDNIHIYSNAGGLLPLENKVERSDDLSPIPLFIEDGGDNIFNAGDYILFYAEGADRIILNEEGLDFEKNVYDNYNYGFIKIEATPNLRVPTQTNIPTANPKNYTHSLLRHEVDRDNLLGQYGSTQGSGKQWFGENFTNDTQQDLSANFATSKAIEGQDAQIKMLFAARSETPSRVVLNIDDKSLNATIASSNVSNVESTYAKVVTITETYQIKNEKPQIDIEFFPATSTSEAWLDYIELKLNERIDLAEGPVFLYDPNNEMNPTSGFEFSYSGSEIKVWNITDHLDVKEIELNRNGNAYNFGYNAGGADQRFISFDPNNMTLAPLEYTKVENQNIHGVEEMDMVIIYYNEFREAAEKLAQHRASNDGFKIELIEISTIYNEFAGGKNDPVAVRDMAKLFHKKFPRFKYMLLLGDATYDYRGIYPNVAYQNFVPTYQTDESLSPVFAYPSDDFFALLSDNEGGDSMRGSLDIGIGRIPAKTLDEAMGVIDKIINYDVSPNRFGEWRAKIGFAADDVDENWDTTHLRDADAIARQTQEANPCLVQQKVYFDSYVQEATPGGARYPEANKAINDNIFKGQLVFNYLGHGGPKGLSQERVLQIRDINSWKNKDKLPVFITATCSFTGFDEPNFVSAGENLILNPKGGAVAIFTTVRSVYANQNKKLTEDLYETIFSRKDDGLAFRLGDIIASSQNTDTISGVENTRKFLLIGDPSMRLALPQHNIEVKSFNGVDVSTGKIDTIGALQKASFTGEITNFKDGSLVQNFNGKVFITIYDKDSQLSTLVNDGKGSPMSFDVRKNVLYKGTASVTNGSFEIEFILPKDINFEFGKGNIHLYATDETTTDAVGCYDNIVIGGSSPVVIDDNEGPLIDIFFNDRSFVFGGKTNKEPILIIDLEDENGINLSSSSIGHDITAALEDKNGNKIVLNEFYEPAVDKTGAGTVNYQMETLEPGLHTLYVKAWDILNNSSEARSEFLVFESEDGFIENVLNYPNPFSTSTEFSFEHDLIGSDIDILLNIYTISGKLIKTIVSNEFSSGNRVNGLFWDARDDTGSKLAKGIYLYKIKISSSELNVSRESDFSKLVILN